MAQLIGAVTQTATATNSTPVVTPQVSAQDRSVAQWLVSQYNGRRGKKSKKVTQKDLEKLMRAGLAIGRARRAVRKQFEEEEAA